MIEVIDASIAIKWFIDEPGRVTALEVLSRILKAPSMFAVPELFYFELANVFNRLIPSPTEEQNDLFNIVSLLGMHRFPMSPDLFHNLQQIQRLGLSGYDAAYVAVAKMNNGIWLTFDEKAHKKIAKLHLSELLTNH